MPWYQNYEPIVGSLSLSAAVASLPILFFLFGLCVLRLSGLVAAIWALVFMIAVAWVEFGMPPMMILGSGLFGVGCAVWPICYIVVMAVWLYRITVADGKFTVIRKSIEGVSTDHRIQALLVAVCFVSFLEGCAAFGTPIAIGSAMLVELGFPVLMATSLTLVGNVICGAFGAAGIPVIVGARQAELEVSGLSRAIIIPLLPASLIAPLTLVLMLDGWRGVRDLWPICIGVGVAFAASQSAVLYFLKGPEIANICAALGSMAVLASYVKWTAKATSASSLPGPGPLIVPTISASGVSANSSIQPEVLGVVSGGVSPGDPEASGDTGGAGSTSAEGAWLGIEFPGGAQNLPPERHPPPVAVRPPPVSAASHEDLTVGSNPTQPSTEADWGKHNATALEVDASHSKRSATSGRRSIRIAEQTAEDLYHDISEAPWQPTLWEILVAWSPFGYLTVAVLVWSIEPFKSLFVPGTGALDWSVVRFPIPGLDRQAMQVQPIKPQPEPIQAVMVWDIVSSSGSALFFSVVLSILTSHSLTMKGVVEQFWFTIRDLWRACALISVVMALAFIANYSGASNTLGLALASFGLLLPIVAPLMGWLGVFLTGSVVNSNVLFAKLQAVSGAQIHVSPYMLVASSTAGAAMAKSVSPQSIAIAAGSVGMTGRESEIMKSTIKTSVAFLGLACIVTGLVALSMGEQSTAAASAAR